MKFEDLKKEVDALIASGNRKDCDFESVHSWEDTLHVEVLQAIADGAPNAADLAREVLRTNESNFPRYCA